MSSIVWPWTTEGRESEHVKYLQRELKLRTARIEELENTVATLVGENDELRHAFLESDKDSRHWEKRALRAMEVIETIHASTTGEF